MRLADIQLTVPAILIALTLDGVARVVLPKGVHDDIADLGAGAVDRLRLLAAIRARDPRHDAGREEQDYVNAARIIGVPGARIALGPRAAQRLGDRCW